MQKLPVPKITSVSVRKVVADAGKYMGDWLASPRPKDLGYPGQQLTPYDQYRRKKLLKLLDPVFFEEKSVLQVGCGPGDLLLEIAKYNPKEIFGLDTSPEEIEIARQRLQAQNIVADLTVISDPLLPYPDSSFDVVLIVQQLQLITNGDLLRAFLAELCRVSRQWLVIIEDTGEQRQQGEGQVVRTVEYYQEFYREHKFYLRTINSLDVTATKTVVHWLGDPGQTLRWVFSPLLYLMGFPRQWLKRPDFANQQPASKLAESLQKLILFLTPGLDDVFKSGVETTKMVFEREKLFRR